MHRLSVAKQIEIPLFHVQPTLADRGDHGQQDGDHGNLIVVMETGCGLGCGPERGVGPNRGLVAVEENFEDDLASLVLVSFTVSCNRGFFCNLFVRGFFYFKGTKG